jgi:hypothetical protein
MLAADLAMLSDWLQKRTEQGILPTSRRAIVRGVFPTGIAVN